MPDGRNPRTVFLPKFQPDSRGKWPLGRCCEETLHLAASVSYTLQMKRFCIAARAGLDLSR